MFLRLGGIEAFELSGQGIKQFFVWSSVKYFSGFFFRDVLESSGLFDDFAGGWTARLASKAAHQGVVRVWLNPFWKLALDFIEEAKASAYVNHEILF